MLITLLVHWMSVRMPFLLKTFFFFYLYKQLYKNIHVYILIVLNKGVWLNITTASKGKYLFFETWKLFCLLVFLLLFFLDVTNFYFCTKRKRLMFKWSVRTVIVHTVLWFVELSSFLKYFIYWAGIKCFFFYALSISASCEVRFHGKTFTRTKSWRFTLTKDLIMNSFFWAEEEEEATLQSVMCTSGLYSCVDCWFETSHVAFSCIRSDIYGCVSTGRDEIA